MLDEGVVADAKDVDTALILGAGWPFFLGGITKHLDQTGDLGARRRPAARRGSWRCSRLRSATSRSGTAARAPAGGRADDRVELRGLGRSGSADRWSDVDLFVTVAEGVDQREVGDASVGRVYEAVPVVHHFAVAFGERSRSRLPAREPARGRRRLPACQRAGRTASGPAQIPRARPGSGGTTPSMRQSPRPRPSLACPVLRRGPPLEDADARHATGSGLELGRVQGGRRPARGGPRPAARTRCHARSTADRARPRGAEPPHRRSWTSCALDAPRARRPARGPLLAVPGEAALPRNPPESAEIGYAARRRPPQGTSGRHLYKVATHEASRACKTRPSTRP